jgi:hypothetical protein
MLRRLKGGEFDEIIAGRRPVDAPAAAPATVAPAPPAISMPEPKSEARPEPRPTVREGNLDEIILSYLLGDDEEMKKP